MVLSWKGNLCKLSFKFCNCVDRWSITRSSPLSTLQLLFCSNSEQVLFIQLDSPRRWKIHHPLIVGKESDSKHGASHRSVLSLLSLLTRSNGRCESHRQIYWNQETQGWRDGGFDFKQSHPAWGWISLHWLLVALSQNEARNAKSILIRADLPEFQNPSCCFSILAGVPHARLRGWASLL